MAETVRSNSGPAYRKWLKRAKRFYRRLIPERTQNPKNEIKDAQPYQRSGYYHVLAPFQPRKSIDAGPCARINLILPSVYAEHLTGGPATLINYVLAIKAALPECTIRLIPVMVPFDGNVSKLPASISGFACVSDPDNESSDDSILLYAAHKSHPVTVAENDIFVASMWPTFYLAKELKDAQQKFFGHSHPIQYIIQDYESSALYSWSSFFLMAEQTYEFPNETIAVVGTEPLSRYLESQGHTFLRKYTFNPTTQAFLTEVAAPGTKEELFVIYGRPDTPRNCFDLIYEALLILTAKHRNVAERVRFVSVGEKHGTLPLNNGAELISLGFLPRDDYKDLIRRASVACFFVVSPHTGYVGIEFAYAGAITVSNSFRTKAVDKIHPNIRVPTSMTPDAVARSFVEAIQETWRNPNGGIEAAREFAKNHPQISSEKKNEFPFIREMFREFYKI